MARVTSGILLRDTITKHAEEAHHERHAPPLSCHRASPLAMFWHLARASGPMFALTERCTPGFRARLTVSGSTSHSGGDVSLVDTVVAQCLDHQIILPPSAWVSPIGPSRWSYISAVVRRTSWVRYFGYFYHRS